MGFSIKVTLIVFIVACTITPSLGFSSPTGKSVATPTTSTSEDLVASTDSSEPATSSLSSVLIDDSIFLNEEESLAELKFPIFEAELINKAKEFLSAGQGVERPEILDATFTFMGPVVGGSDGLGREAYLEAVGGFNLKAAFPDLNPRFHDFRADKLDAGRVWFTSVASGTDNGTGFLGNKPTGKSFRTPPQACSLKFNEEGKATKYTIGHVMERSLGNTGGLGGIFGPAYAIGKALPFPEAQPYKPSKRFRLITTIGRLASSIKKKSQKA